VKIGKLEVGTVTDHFEITVKSNAFFTGINFQADFYKANFDKQEFAIDALQNEVSVMRYILGLTPGGTTTKTIGGRTITENVSINTITASELGFLASWMKGKRGNRHSYTVGI
jgi:hypothetical protein